MLYQPTFNVYLHYGVTVLVVGVPGFNYKIQPISVFYIGCLRAIDWQDDMKLQECQRLVWQRHNVNAPENFQSEHAPSEYVVTFL